jgi:hypothetical protein
VRAAADIRNLLERAAVLERVKDSRLTEELWLMGKQSFVHAQKQAALDRIVIPTALYRQFDARPRTG